MSKLMDLPRFGWLFAGILVSACFGLLIPERRFVPAFADGLMISGSLLFAIAWLLHLRADGLRLIPPRAPKDKLPEPGNSPAPPSPLPGDDGPSSEAYLRLEEAERKLRERIAGEDTGGDKDSRLKAGKGAGGLAVSGAILFLLSLVFQYLVPRLLAS